MVLSVIKNLTVKSDNYKKFCDQLEEVIIKYPNLSIANKNGEKFLKGILDIPNDESIIVSSYLVEIYFTNYFPFRFPKLYEIGGDIPNNIDWHKFADNSCCITVLPDEILKCKTGIGLLEFIEKYCFSFFANHIFRKREGQYLNGEYGHGIKGVQEFYSNLLKTAEVNKWLSYFRYIFLGVGNKYGRNDKCFCDSNEKFKNCHLKIFELLREIGYEQCLYDFKRIFPNSGFN